MQPCFPTAPMPSPCASSLAMQLFKGCRYGCPCQVSLGRLVDVVASVFPGLPATQNLQLLCCLSHICWPQQASVLLNTLELQHLEAFPTSGGAKLVLGDIALGHFSAWAQCQPSLWHHVASHYRLSDKMVRVLPNSLTVTRQQQRGGTWCSQIRRN